MQSISEKRAAFSQLILSAFAAIFCVCFSFIIISVIFSNKKSFFIAPAVIFIVLLNIAVLFLISRTVSQHEEFFKKHFRLILFCSLSFFFILNIIFGFMLRFNPEYDLAAIFKGAISWLEKGFFTGTLDETCNRNYFYFFPNNLGGLSFLYLIFKTASFFSITDYFAVAMIVNASLATLAMLLTVIITRCLGSVRQSITALLIILMFPPFYFIAPAFYTDSLSLIFPLLMIYLYLRYTDSCRGISKLFLAILIAIVCAAGMLIKFTTIIALIAIIIYHICTNRFRSLLPIIICSITIIFMAFSLFNSYFYSNHLRENRAEKLNTPYTHWVMMSLYKNGTYNRYDYAFTRSFDDPDERKAAVAQEIQERINERGFWGMLELFYAKGSIAFGEPTLALSDFLDDNPQHETALHSFLLYKSVGYPIYHYFCSGIYFALLILMTVAATSFFTKNRSKKCILPLLCVFGIYLFLMVWEVSGRYVTNFVPFIIISATFGLDVFTKRFIVLYNKAIKTISTESEVS